MTTDPIPVSSPTRVLDLLYPRDLDSLPSEAATRDWLRAGLENMQERNQRSTEEIAAIVRNWDSWRFRAKREGSNNYHYWISAAIPLADGRAVGVQIDYAIAKDTADLHEIDQMLVDNIAANSHLNGDLGDEVYGRILANVTNCIVEVYEPEAIEWLRRHAPVGTTDEDLVQDSAQYWDTLGLTPRHGEPGYGAWFDAREERDRIIDESIYYTVVDLSGNSEGVTAESILEATFYQAAKDAAEELTHIEEATHLHRQLRHSPNLSGEAKGLLMTRLVEILDGANVSSLYNLRDLSEMILAQHLKDHEWNAGSIIALRKVLGLVEGELPDPAFSLFASRVSSFTAAAKGLRQIVAVGREQVEG